MTCSILENHSNILFSIVNFFGFAGAEMRALSAIDVALWDWPAAPGPADLRPIQQPQPRPHPHLRRLRALPADAEHRAGEPGGGGGRPGQGPVAAGRLRDEGFAPFDRIRPDAGRAGQVARAGGHWGPAAGGGVLGDSMPNDDLKKGVHVFQNVK